MFVIYGGQFLKELTVPRELLSGNFFALPVTEVSRFVLYFKTFIRL